MINGVHAMFHGPQPEELRSFFRDKLGLTCVDVGQGWLIFPIEGEAGFHSGERMQHEISLCCDDIYSTVEELVARGVEFEHAIEDFGLGIGTYIVAPGRVRIRLYQRALSVGAR
jgi:hypothetical protein